MPFDSLSVGVSGLDAYQSQIDLISNNIANVGTTGFKGQNMTFQDLFYQQQAAASAPTATNGGINAQETGLGVKVATTDTNLTQGGLQTTGVNTNLAINGDGYFVLGNTNGLGSPTYTRDGDFSINQNGTLVDQASGKAVQGYQATAAGVLPPAGSQPTSLSIPIGLTTTAVGTGFGTKIGPTTNDQVFDILQGGNLNSSSWQAEEAGVVAATPGVGPAQSASTTIYDSLGTSHLATYTFKPDATGATALINGLPPTVVDASGITHVPATRWKVSVTFADGTLVSNGAGAGAATAVLGYAYFDQNGQYINTSGAAPSTVAIGIANAHQAGQNPSGAAGDLMDITQWGPGIGNASIAPTATGGPPATGPIGMSFADMTSLAGNGSPVTTVSQNGYPQGTLTNLNIGQDGTVTGAYTNGQQKTLAQVVLATFENEQGLTRNGSSQYTPSPDSGLAQVGNANSGRFGAIIAGSLEQSNVSIADEFTKLIMAQRAFEANSKSITTADQDLQLIVTQLKQ